MVQNQTLFAGVDHFAVVQGFILFGQLSFRSQLCKDLQDLAVNRACAVVEGQTFAHGNRIVLHALCAVFAGHGGDQINGLYIFQLFISCQGIHVFPCDHVDVLLDIISHFS